MNATYEIQYPILTEYNYNTGTNAVYWDFLVTKGGKTVSLFSIQAAQAVNYFDRIIDFDHPALFRNIIVYDAESIEQEAKKVASLLEDILAYCMQNSENPIKLLESFFPPPVGSECYPASAFGMFDLCNVILKHQVTVNWSFLNQRLNTLDAFDEDLFDERIRIELTWLGLDGSIDKVVVYWSLVSVKQIKKFPLPHGFYYRRFVVVAHFFYKPQLDAIIQNVVAELNKVAPQDRKTAIIHRFSAQPIECMWSST